VRVDALTKCDAIRNSSMYGRASAEGRIDTASAAMVPTPIHAANRKRASYLGRSKRTMIANRSATVVISIELRCENRLGLAARKNLDAVATTILGLLDEAAIHATWGIEFPAGDSWAQALARRHPSHEIALLGDATWVGPAATRARFAAELSRRIATARAAGIEISSLILTDTDLRRDLDIAVKHGVTAVGPAVTHASAGSPSPLRYGLWRIPATARLPESTRRFLSPASRTTIRHIDAAVSVRGLCHLVIDAGQLTAANERTIRQVFTHLARQRIAGQLALKSLAGFVVELTHSHPGRVAARSILREAA